MPYTAAQLNQFYTNTNQGAAPDSATQAVFASYAQQNMNGQLTDAQTISLVTNTAQTRATVDVALATYQFYTGSTPTTGTTGGLNYLVNNPGTGLNTSYFNGTGTGASATAPGTGGFNNENRYYNESIALATNATTGANFVTNYGALSFNDTVRVAYEQIVGTGSVGTANANAAIANIQGSLAFFTQIAQSRAGGVDTGGAAGQNIALKAVVVGYILEEAVKADVGTYAKAIDNFNAANAQGTAISGANLLTAYAPGTSGDTLGGTTTGGTTATGVSITYGAGTTSAVGLNSADPNFRSTTANDTLLLSAGTIDGVTIDLNAGNDMIIGATVATLNTQISGAIGSTSVSMGAGNDAIGSAAAPVKLIMPTGTNTILIDGGAGTDTAFFTVAANIDNSGANTTTITGIETLSFGAVGTRTVDASTFTGVTTLGHFDATGATGALTLTGIAAGVTVAVASNAGASTFTYAAAGAAALSLTGSNAAVTVNAAAALNANALTL